MWIPLYVHNTVPALLNAIKDAKRDADRFEEELTLTKKAWDDLSGAVDFIEYEMLPIDYRLARQFPWTARDFYFIRTRYTLSAFEMIRVARAALSFQVSLISLAHYMKRLVKMERQECCPALIWRWLVSKPTRATRKGD